jgi:hypothetical protein
VAPQSQWQASHIKIMTDVAFQIRGALFVISNHGLPSIQIAYFVVHGSFMA